MSIGSVDEVSSFVISPVFLNFVSLTGTVHSSLAVVRVSYRLIYICSPWAGKRSITCLLRQLTL